MHNYPSDITRGEFDIIREDLESAKKTTKPRTIDLYDVFCAILYQSVRMRRKIKYGVALYKFCYHKIHRKI